MSAPIIDILLHKDSERYHPKTSPYYNLTIQQQRDLQKIRHGPGRVPKPILRKLRKASKQDYDSIIIACTNALVFGADDLTDTRLDRITIDIKLYFGYRKYFDKSFPRPVILGYDDYSVFARFKVDKLLNWLHEHGKCPYSARELRKELWAINKEMDKVLFLHEYAAPISIVEGYVEIIKEAPVRKDRGRRGYRKKQKLSEDCVDTKPET